MFICLLLSNTHFTRKQNSSKLQFFINYFPIGNHTWPTLFVIVEIEKRQYPLINYPEFPEEISSSDEPKKQWPLIDIESISAHIELGQLFNKDKPNEIFAHIDSQFDDEDLLNLVKSEGNSRGLNVEDSSSEVLPPASVQTTLKVSNKSIPGI